MKIVELLNSVKLPVTNEEADLLDRFFDDDSLVPRSRLNERQQHVANQLVNKDVLLRRIQNGQTIYSKKIR